MQPSIAWSPETQYALEAAGWYPGRRETGLLSTWRKELTVAGHFTMTLSAERALEEFGNIRVDRRGAGIECARGGFHIDPTLAAGEEDRFSEREAQLGVSLTPLGEAFDGHVFLAIDDKGHVYLLGDEIQWLASSIHEALDALLQGWLPKSRGSIAV